MHGLLTTEDTPCEVPAFSYTSIPGTHWVTDEVSALPFVRTWIPFQMEKA